jgi:hypothetical protein
MANRVSPNTITLAVILLFIGFIIGMFFNSEVFFSSSSNSAVDTIEETSSAKNDLNQTKKNTSKDRNNKILEGKRLYLYWDLPCFGDGSTPYLNYCFLENNLFIGSANFSGAPFTPTEQIYKGKWRIEGQNVIAEFKIWEATYKKYKKNTPKKGKIVYTLDHFSDIDAFAEMLIKKHWTGATGKILFDYTEKDIEREYGSEVLECVQAHPGILEYSFKKMKYWAFDEVRLCDKRFERKYPFTSQRKLTPKELNKYSKPELRIMRNEIFADYCYLFKNKDLKKIFEHSECFDIDFAEIISPLEKENIQIIKNVENLL